MQGNLLYCKSKGNQEQLALNILQKKKKRDPVDYNSEIPFERVVPQVRFEADQSETPKPNLDFGNINIMKLEGTKQFIEFEKRKLEDQEKMKKLKEKDLPSAISLINKQNNPIMKPKTKLIMPTPQLHDKDLEFLGKMNSQTSMGIGSENAATKALIGNYTIRESTTSVMRTPRQMDSILIQAQNAAAQRNLQTPLLGGQNVQLIDEKYTNNQIPSTPHQFSELIGQANQTPNLRKANLPQQNSILRPLPKMTPMHVNQEEIIDANWEQQQQGQQLNQEKLEKLKQQQLKQSIKAVSYTHLRAHETGRNLVCRLLLEKKKKKKNKNKKQIEKRKHKTNKQ
eukprot:TRINITY_DN6684_c0_g2_i2.p1 TRINITY_DN6684_c0_g2~~TRINITY_DN6684_c0_g2_i2.p1  ORF type:complete len:340 (-),score=57.46 TRINITY_DN6684_c0_g2_i2:12-1031(-)